MMQIDGASCRKADWANHFHSLIGVVLTTIAAASLGCRTPARPVTLNPGLKIPVEELSERIQTVCLLSIESQIELEETEAKQDELEDMLKNQLRRLGFAVVGSEEVVDVRTHIREKEDGFYNIHWGNIVGAKRDAIRKKFLEEAANKLDCDAIVETEIVQVESFLWNDRAKWDHRTHIFPYYVTGHVSAISLRIRLIDLDGQELYFGAGGVQLAVQVEEDEFTNPHFESIAKEHLLAEERENRRAMRFALRALKIKLSELNSGTSADP